MCTGLQVVGRAADAEWATVQLMGVDHGAGAGGRPTASSTACPHYGIYVGAHPVVAHFRTPQQGLSRAGIAPSVAALSTALLPPKEASPPPGSTPRAAVASAWLAPNPPDPDPAPAAPDTETAAPIRPGSGWRH